MCEDRRFIVNYGLIISCDELFMRPLDCIFVFICLIAMQLET